MWRLNLSQKIGGGYFLSLGITTIGIISGFVIGDYHEQQAVKLREYNQEEIRLLNDLENQLLQLKTYQYQFIYLVDKPKLLKQKKADFLQNETTIYQLWSELEKFVNKDFLINKENTRILSHFITQNKWVHTAYFQGINELLVQVNELNSKQKNKDTEKLLLNFNNSTVKIKMDNSVNELNVLINLAYKQNENAEIVPE